MRPTRVIRWASACPRETALAVDRVRAHARQHGVKMAAGFRPAKAAVVLGDPDDHPIKEDRRGAFPPGRIAAVRIAG